MQFLSLLSIILVVPAAIAAPADPQALHARNIEKGLSKDAIATLRKLNAGCYKKCIDQCNSFSAAGAAMVETCINRNCAPMARDGRCLRSAKNGTRDLRAKPEARAVVEADIETPAPAATLRARNIEKGLSKDAIATLRKLNAGCYKKCIDQCNSFSAAGPAMVETCINRNCAPMARDGRCLRSARNGTRGLRAEQPDAEADVNVDAE